MNEKRNARKKNRLEVLVLCIIRKVDKIQTVVKNNSDKRLHKKRQSQRKVKNLKDTN